MHNWLLLYIYMSKKYLSICRNPLYFTMSRSQIRFTFTASETGSCAVIIVPFLCITVYGRWSNGEVSLSLFRCRTSTAFSGTMARDFACRLRSAYRFIFIFASLSFSFNAWLSCTVHGCEIVCGSLVFISRPNSAVAGALHVGECCVAL